MYRSYTLQHNIALYLKFRPILKDIRDSSKIFLLMRVAYTHKSFKISVMPNSPLPKSIFIKRLSRNFAIGIFTILISLFIGMWGYHYFEDMPWLDAYLNAAMILSGMGPVLALHTTAGKIFAGTYAIFSGVVFLVVIAIVFAPVVHHFFHRFHMQQ